MKKIALQKDTTATTYRIHYEQELNAAQLEAVLHTDGPALIIAGAGTGKTRTLVYRVARLVENRIPPENILLLTFTRKAAREMLRRAAVLLDGRCQRVMGGTFHSFAYLILRRFAEFIGFSPNFSVLDQTDAADTIQLVRTEVLGKQKQRFPTKETLRSLFSAVVNLQRSLSDLVEERYPQFLGVVDRIEEVAQRYRTYKQQHQLMDYDDLLLYLLQLLQDYPDIRRQLGNEFRYVMVDEYQDTNYLQHQIVIELVAEHRNIVAVGDDAQSIYGFRGARIENMQDLPAVFPECRIIKLEENYRSTQPILNFANVILQNSVELFPKHLYTRKQGGDKPAIVKTETEQQQSQYIVQQILEFVEEGIPLSEIAVLFRAAYHSMDLEIELQKARIPFQKFGGLKFSEAAHIKDVLAHLRLMLNPTDAVSWHRVLLLLKGVGPRTAQRVVEAVVSGKLQIGRSNDFSSFGKAASSIESLFRLLGKSATELSTPADQLFAVLEYYRPILWDRYDDAQRRWNDLETLLSIADRYEHLEGFLTDIALEPIEGSLEAVQPVSPEEEILTLSTVHSAKGLEWKAVFLIWMVDGRFPPPQAQESIERMEEERRLFYVACTRAKEHLILTYPEQMYSREHGRVLTLPSPFLQELPPDIAEHYIVVESEE